MRLLFKLLLWLLFLSPFAIAAVFWLALSGTPLVGERPPLSQQDLLRAREIVKQHRLQQAGSAPLRLALSEHDLEVAGNYLLQRLAGGGLRIRIRNDRLEALATLRIPGVPTRPYLNLRLQLRQQKGQPNLVQLRIDDWNVPPGLAKRLLAELLVRLYDTDEYRLARSIVDDIQLRDRMLGLQYHWTPELARKARATFLKAPSRAREVYRSELRRLVGEPRSKSFSLTRVLPPLFGLALKRSRQGDPLTENRALLSVLGYWATDRRTLATDLVGMDSGPPLPFRATLHGRRDMAQHFLLSAALAANTGDTLASMAGTFKEIADADRGSGFSFVDLAADRAGLYFARLALGSETEARRFQELVAAGIAERDIVPDVRALGEGMNLAQFRRHYGDLDSPLYREAIETIDRHIEQCRLYRAVQR